MKDWGAWLVIGLAAAVGVVTWRLLTAHPCSIEDECLRLHEAMQAGTALSPWRYRAALTVVPGTALAFGAAHAAALAGLYWLLYAYTKSLAPVVLIAAVLPTMFNASWGWVGVMTIVEAATWAGLLLLARRQEETWAKVSALALSAAAALNRETAVFLGPLWWLVTRDWRTAAAMTAGAAGVYGGLRLALGSAADSVPIADAWRMNTGGGWHTQNAVINLALLAAPAWAAVRQAGDQLTRRALWIGVVYVPTVAIFGLWNETRLLLPMMTLLAMRFKGKARLRSGLGIRRAGRG